MKRRSVITEEVRIQLLHQREPEASFVFPPSIYKDKRYTDGCKRRVQRDWFRKFDWLSYSKQTDSLYCLACCIHSQHQYGHQDKEQFITKGYTNWKKAMEKMKEHDQNASHRFASEQLKTWQNIRTGVQKSASSLLDPVREAELKRNRNALKSILSVLVLCGRQGLSLRGHRDDGAVDVEDLSTPSVHNEGNFRALLINRIEAGDEALLDHLKHNSKRNTYISKSSQNVLLQLLGNHILSKIVDDIRSQPGSRVFFSVIADEVTDLATTSQLGVSIRYVNKEFVIKDQLIGFKCLSNLKGADIASELMQVVKSLGLDVKDTIGLGFDGAGNMSGKY